MEFYTLNENFVRIGSVIDEFSSAIWTERFAKTGDVTLVVSPTAEMRKRLVEGTFVQVNDSDQVAQIDTALVEGGQLKVTGNMLDEFLNERIVRATGVHTDKSLNIYALTPAQAMIKLVQAFVVSGGAYTTPLGGFDRTKQIIPNLVLVDPPPSYPPGTRHIMSLPPGGQMMSIPYGPLYDALEQFGNTYQVGFKIYLYSHPDGNGYTLYFKTWTGKDRTSQQSENAVVQFSPSMDSLTNIKELRSIATYKTVAYAYAGTDPNNLGADAGYAEAYPGAGDEVGFARRNLMVTVDDVGEEITDANAMKLLLDQRAKDALANNNYTKVVDGEVIPSQFVFGLDYDLGDIVELNSGTGIIQEARITEYIRSEDDTGERAYPTVSVI